MKNSQNGNALWFILIAIFLLGGLTAMLTRGSGNTEDTGGDQTATIKAAELLRYTNGLAASVQKLSLGGCSENDISFYSTKWGTPANYDNTNTPVAGANFKCHVFHKSGGGYIFANLPSSVSSTTEYIISGSNAISNIAGTGNELVVIAPNLTVDVCKAINRSFGISNYAKDDASADSYFIGDLATNVATLGDDNTNPTYVAGKKAFCMQANAFGGLSNDSYFFVQVLMAR